MKALKNLFLNISPTSNGCTLTNNMYMYELNLAVGLHFYLRFSRLASSDINRAEQLFIYLFSNELFRTIQQTISYHLSYLTAFGSL